MNTGRKSSCGEHQTDKSTRASNSAVQITLPSREIDRWLNPKKIEAEVREDMKLYRKTYP